MKAPRRLCQGCVMLTPERHLHIPHQSSTIEKEIYVCAPCHARISEAIETDTDLDISVVGSRILGVRTKTSDPYSGWEAARF